MKIGHAVIARGLVVLALGAASDGFAQAIPHPNARARHDMEEVANRDDVRHLPAALKNRLITLAGRPHSVLPVQAFAEANRPSQLFQYFLIDTHGFERNVFTTIFPGVND